MLHNTRNDWKTLNVFLVFYYLLYIQILEEFEWSMPQLVVLVDATISYQSIII